MQYLCFWVLTYSISIMPFRYIHVVVNDKISCFLSLSSILLKRRQWHPTPVLSPSKIPWMEEPGRLRSTGSLRVRHNWVTSLSLSLSCIREGNGNPLQRSCLENPRDGGAWWAAVYGVAQSRTRLKQLSSSSSSSILLCGLGHSRHTHCVWLSITLWTVAHQTPLSMGFSRQE